MNPALQARMELLRGIGVEIAASDWDCSSLASRTLLAKVFPEGKNPEPGVTFLHVSDLSLDEIRDRFREVELEEKSTIDVVYPALRQGLTVRWHDFIRHYDDLWYPGADDVVLIEERCLAFLSLSHEEWLTLFRPPLRLGS